LGNGDDIFYNINQFKNNKTKVGFKDISEDLLFHLKTTARIIKNSLKIKDYLTIKLVTSEVETKLNYDLITPSPDIGVNSKFCVSLMNLGLRYEEIIAGILVSAMIRNNISIPENFKELQSKLTSSLENDKVFQYVKCEE